MKTQFEKFVSSFWPSAASTVFIVLVSLTLSFAGVSYAFEAQACRDCPFPMKIGEGRWIMPGGDIEINIDQVRLPSRLEEVHVTLRDAGSGDILAQGMVKQKSGRRTMNVRLIDKDGREILGFVRFIDQDRDKIQADFSCEHCQITAFMSQKSGH